MPTSSSSCILFGRGDAGARERRRRLEFRAVLHARHQPVSQAGRPHSRRRQRARIPRRRRSDPAARLRDLRASPTSSATASDPTASSSFSRSTRRTTSITIITSPPTSRPGGSRAWSRPRRSAAARARATSAARSSSRSSIRSRRRSAATCASCRSRRSARIAIWCCRCRSARGTTDLSLDVAAPVTSIRVVSGPSRPFAPLADGAVSWRAISHLSLNYLSLVQSTAQEGAAALRDLLQLYASDADVSARRQVEGIRSVQVARVVRRLRGAGAAGLRPRAGDRGARGGAGVRGGQRLPARRRSRSILRPARLDQLVHGNRIAIREPRGDQPMGATVGRETDAVAFFAELARRAVSSRFLSDAAPAGVLVRPTSRAGAARSGRSTSPCGSGRIRISRSRRLRWRRSRPRTARYRGCRSGCSACSGRTDRCRFTSPSTRANGCATTAIRRSAASSISFTIASSRCSTGRGRSRSRTSTAIARTTIASRVTSARSSGLHRRRSAIAIRCRISRSCSTSARSSGRSGTPRG